MMRKCRSFGDTTDRRFRRKICVCFSPAARTPFRFSRLRYRIHILCAAFRRSTVHSRDAINYVYEAVSREINAVTDNPLVFPDEDEVISGGNFHGQPMALAFDFMKMAISELADVSERRAERLINPALSEGLPGFLTKHGGVCSGFMIAQYAAASMVSEKQGL